MMENSHSLDEDCWEYVDPKGLKQGPFSGARMLQWYEHKMLPAELRVRSDPMHPFAPIRELFQFPQLPFKTRPRPAALGPASISAMKWLYRDNKGLLQGPFTSAQMAQWYEHKMLPAHLPLKRDDDTRFVSIGDYFPPPMVPFVSQPSEVSKTSSAHLPIPGPLEGVGLGGPVGGAGLGGISLGSGAAFLAKAAQVAQAAQGVEASSVAKAAAVPAQPQPAPVAAGKQPQAKAKAVPKTDAAYPKNGQHDQVVDILSKGVEGQKGAGKGGEGPIGGRSQKGASQKNDAGPDAWQWSEQNWDGKNWWDAAWWNGGWAADGGWVESNGKLQGAEWKGKGGDGEGSVGPSPAKEKHNAVQAAFGSLPWGPQLDDQDLFPEEYLRKVQDEGIIWEERWVCPLLVRFSQGKIHPFFHGRGPISEVMLQMKLRDPEHDDKEANLRRIDPPFPPIRLLHLKEQGVLVTLDNRRLYALQRFAMQEWPTVCLARALCVDELTPTRLRAENRKFTNRLCGLQLEVESRQNAFDTFSWVTDAGHMEAPKFCRPVAFKAADKAISMFPMLVVHALLCPRFRPLLRSRWLLLQYLAGLLRSPCRRAFPSRRVLRQHVMELPRPSRRTGTCPPLTIEYQAETVVTLRKGKSCVTSKLSVSRPLQLQQGMPLSDIQRRILRAMLPLFCLPYARSVLCGETLCWVEVLLLAWGKVAMVGLKLDI